MPAPARRAAVAATASLCLLLTGCTGSAADSVDRARERASALVDDVQAAVEQAKERAGAASGEVGQQAPATSSRPIRTDTNTAFDYAQYSTTLENVIGSLRTYWSTALPQAFGVEYSAPSRYVYYRPEEQPGPSCGGEQAPPRNAFYCPAGDFIAWDESGLVIPYYVGAGDFAAAFVIAHEFGHAMQARLPEREPLTILSELQADCFAGSWSRYAQEQGQLSQGDLDEATLAVFSARDLPGTDFADPAAHGTGFERTRAFADGYESGPGACYRAPRSDWLIGP